MAEGPRTWMRRKVPAIAWRDELLVERANQVRQLRIRLAEQAGQVEELQFQVAAAEQQTTDLQADLRREKAAHGRIKAQASPPQFRRRLQDLGRRVRYLGITDPGATHPMGQIRRKLRNYELAASHGVSIPEVVQVWGDLDALDLAGMPETFVVKSDSGSSGRGVLPLRRLDDDVFEMVGGGATFSQDEIRRYFRDPSLGGPYFAEEVLVQPGGGVLPDDIKFYMFYGEVGHIMLRRMPQHANLRQARVRFLDGAGVDLGDDVAPPRRVDSSIEPPERLDDYVKIARHLSRAVALPFVRVDVYDTTQGPMFGELTRGPGGKQRFREDHDHHLARLWDQAQCRLDLDVVAGRPLRHLHGEHPAPSLYPPGHAPPGEQPGAGRGPALVSCQTWCLGGIAPVGLSVQQPQT